MNIAVGIVVYKRDYFIGRASEAVRRAQGVDTVRIWDNSENNIGQDAAIAAMHEQWFSDGYDVVFTMEDGCLIMPWTFAKLAEVLVEKGEIGIACPSLTYGPPCQAFPWEYLPNDWLGSILNYTGNDPWPEGIDRFTCHPFLEWNTLKAVDPFCWGLTRETYEAVGPVDAEFWQGWGTMNDYAYRARKKGIHSAVVWNAFSITWDRHVDVSLRGDLSDRQEWMSRGIQRVNKKYGVGGWEKMDSNYIPIMRINKNVQLA